ncbi:MAG: DUF2461 domain-containing protein [Yoonia sp.]|nr:DUF2461 domain-containing protein [Yoonia sp.]
MSENLIQTAQVFYKDLAANNTKAWWDAHRGTYDDVLKPAALALMGDLAPAISDVADMPVKLKLFRPHRDVRFSKDKTPYKTHLHMMWTLNGDGRQNPVFFFGIGEDYVTVGSGMMGFDKPVLEDWRKFVDLDAKRIIGIVDGVTTDGFRLRDPALKRVPAAYPADHPAAHLLRMKGCVASKDIGQPADLHDAILNACKQVAPLTALLVQIAEA